MLPEFLNIRIYFRNGVVKDLRIQATNTANEAWDFLIYNFGKIETFYTKQENDTKGFWIRTADVIYIERIS
jgi:hypothetical protein